MLTKSQRVATVSPPFYLSQQISRTFLLLTEPESDKTHQRHLLKSKSRHTSTTADAQKSDVERRKPTSKGLARGGNDIWQLQGIRRITDRNAIRILRYVGRPPRANVTSSTWNRAYVEQDKPVHTASYGPGPRSRQFAEKEMDKVLRQEVKKQYQPSGRDQKCLPLKRTSCSVSLSNIESSMQ